MTATAQTLSPPSKTLMFLEGRALSEFGAFLGSLPLLGLLPRGDGHPVLVLPGLMASDSSTRALRAVLKARGYAVKGWGLGRNYGLRDGVQESVIDLLTDMHETHGRKVSLVGWSLGGIYARELAKEAPDEVRCVVTLGTPFTGHPRATNAWRFYELVSGHQTHDAELLAEVRRPPPVPTTSIYSRTDGIVAWECSINPPGHPHTENIEVRASHLGMGMNPLALYAIADRLRQDPAHWRRFDVAGARRWFFKVAHQPHALVDAY